MDFFNCRNKWIIPDMAKTEISSKSTTQNIAFSY
jgi:hypothetical protein